jgi:hypothetical protein
VAGGSTKLGSFAKTGMQAFGVLFPKLRYRAHHLNTNVKVGFADPGAVGSREGIDTPVTDLNDEARIAVFVGNRTANDPDGFG